MNLSDADVQRCADLGLTHAARVEGVLVARRRGLPVVFMGDWVGQIITTRLVGPGPALEYQPRNGKRWWPVTKASGNVAKWRLKS